MTELDKIKKFLILNGWVEDNTEPDYIHYEKDENITVDIAQNGYKIVFISDWGDFANMYGDIMYVRFVNFFKEANRLCYQGEYKEL